jgi:hypothetical protein
MLGREGERVEEGVEEGAEEEERTIQDSGMK